MPSIPPRPNPVELTGAQRRSLRAVGHHLDAHIQIGHRGITEGLIAATIESLDRHELIKISVAREAPIDRKEAPESLALATGSHVAQVLGRTALLYRRRFDDPVIDLPGVVVEASRPVEARVIPADPRTAGSGKAGPSKPAPSKAAPRAPRAPAPRTPATRGPVGPMKPVARSARGSIKGTPRDAESDPRGGRAGESAPRPAPKGPPRNPPSAPMIIQIDELHPSPYRIERVLTFLNDDGVVAIPTDTTYALACLPDNKTAVDKLRALRRIDAQKPLALVFSDIRQVSEFTLVTDFAYRLLRRYLPGPYCFILEANRKLPRFISDKRKHVGIRVPAHAIPQALVSAVGQPLIVTTALDLDTNEPLNDPWAVESLYGHGLSAVIDAGEVPGGVSSVVDLTGDELNVIREGLGDCSEFLL